MTFAHAYPFVLALISLMLFMAYHWNRAKKFHPAPSFAFRSLLFVAAAYAVV
jgi:hypothetical protein